MHSGSKRFGVQMWAKMLSGVCSYLCICEGVCALVLLLCLLVFIFIFSCLAFVHVCCWHFCLRICCIYIYISFSRILRDWRIVFCPRWSRKTNIRRIQKCISSTSGKCVKMVHGYLLMSRFECIRPTRA